MLTVYNKAIVSVVGAVLSVLAYHGVAVPSFLSPEAVGAAINALTPILVFLIPNLLKDRDEKKSE